MFVFSVSFKVLFMPPYLNTYIYIYKAKSLEITMEKVVMQHSTQFPPKKIKSAMVLKCTEKRNKITLRNHITYMNHWSQWY